MNDPKIKQNIVKQAMRLLEVGFSVIPCHDGSTGSAPKTPSVKWKEYQTEKMRAKHLLENMVGHAFSIAPTPTDGIECLDFDKKNYPEGRNIQREFFLKLREILPEVAKKLYIQTTPSGGVHMVYSCKEVQRINANEAKEILKNDPEADPEELERRKTRGVVYANNYQIVERNGKKKVQGLGMIETRTFEGYFLCAPSQIYTNDKWLAYTAVQGSMESLPEVTLEQRKTILDLARSFELADVKELLEAQNNVEQSATASNKTYRTKQDSFETEFPDEVKSFQLFNEAHDALEVLKSLYGVTEAGKSGDGVLWLRPGKTDNKTSGIFFPSSNLIYVHSTSFALEANRHYSPADIFTINKGADPETDFEGALKILREAGFGKKPEHKPRRVRKPKDSEKPEEPELAFTKFWDTHMNNKGKLIVTFPEDSLVQFLVEQGFKRFKVTEEAEVKFKRVKKNVVYNVTEEDFFIFLRDFIEEHFGDVVEVNDAGVDLTKRILLQFTMAQNIKVKNLFKYVPNLTEDEFIKPNMETGFLFFKNTAVKITNGKSERIPYDKLDGYVWAKQVKKHDFNGGDANGKWKEFNYNAVAFKDNYMALKCAFGYLAHDYFAPVRKGIILTDRFSTMEENNGRTGKTLFATGLKEIVATTTIQGKTFSMNSNFLFQEVDFEDHVLVLNDVAKGTPIEAFYNVITDKITVEKKGRDVFQKEIKFLATTNHLFQTESGASSEARIMEIEFGDHYNLKHTPRDDAGFFFFSEKMSQAEWDSFFQWSIEAIQLHLEVLDRDPSSGGLIAPEVISEEHKNKKIISEVGPQLFQWLEENFDEDHGFRSGAGLPYHYFWAEKDGFFHFMFGYKLTALWSQYKTEYKSKMVVQTFKKNVGRYLQYLGIDYLKETKKVRPNMLNTQDRQPVNLFCLAPKRLKEEGQEYLERHLHSRNMGDFKFN